MGHRSRFECECGFEAQVSGSYDRGFNIFTMTTVCDTCKRLKDTVISRDEGTSRSVHLADRACACGAKTLRPWHTGDPCPRCGKPLTSSGLFSVWD